MEAFVLAFSASLLSGGRCDGRGGSSRCGAECAIA